MRNNNRFHRIDEELKKELSNIINYELKNPKITGMISVTRVQITPDLKFAKIYVSILGAKNNQESLDGLKQSSGFMRSEIAKRINLRITPELVFTIDDSLEYGAKIDNILKKISDDKKEEN